MLKQGSVQGIGDYALMPELPEVESIARKLRDGNGNPPLTGQTITHATVSWPRHIAIPAASTFRRNIRSRLIKSVGRRGKYLVFGLDRGTLLLHLRMSGDLYMTRPGTAKGRYEHTVFHLDTDWQLRFSDARKFGKVYLLKSPEKILDRLGPEPLDPGFTVDEFQSRLRTKKRLIKPLIMDQTFLAGMGNIYTDEALFIAKIHPRTRSDQLTDSQISDLWHAIRSALEEGIRANGASIDWVYAGGNFQNQFRVYQRTGEPCLRCGTQIERITLGQRGTHYCPSCQQELTDES